MSEVLREAEELLPFVVNGTATAEERETVEAAMAQHPDLRDQQAALTQMRQQIKAMPADHSPGAFGLARLMRDLDADDTQTTAAPTAPTNVVPFARFQSYALAASLALAAFLAVPYLTPSDEALYEQASGEIGVAEAPILSVAFQPSATEAQISNLLLDAGLVIVEGPTAIGLYHIASLDGEDAVTLAATLQAAQDIVERVDLLE